MNHSVIIGSRFTVHGSRFTGLFCSSLSEKYSSLASCLYSWGSFKEALKKHLPKSAVKAIRRSKNIFRTKIVVPLKIKFNRPLIQRQNKVMFEVQLAEHCNLNCAGCSHFSPVAKPEFVDVEEFRRDFERMGEIFSHECKAVYLLGGEPLLHPELNTLLEIVRSNFTSGQIVVVTNGILLLSLGEDFWRLCRDKNIEISVTHYPIKLNTEGIFRTAEKFGVKVEMRSEDEKVLFRKDPIDLTGSQNIQESFALCMKHCSTLKHGKFYNCSFTPHVHHFNEAFGQNVAVTKDDYIDIYDNVTKDMLLDFMCKPVPACRYCNMKRVNFFTNWHISKREMSEWV